MTTDTRNFQSYTRIKDLVNSEEHAAFVFRGSNIFIEIYSPTP
jgi:hypothetical protein